MSALRCPSCELISPPSAMRCDCGYDFRLRAHDEPFLTSQQQRSRTLNHASTRYLKIYLLFIGGGLLLRGLIALLRALSDH